MYPYVCMYIHTLQNISTFSLMKNIVLHHSHCASSSSAKPMVISVYLLTSACVHSFPFSPLGAVYPKMRSNYCKEDLVSLHK